MTYFLRLKLALLGGAFRRSPWQIVGVAVAIVYGAGFTLAAVIALVALRFTPVQFASEGVVIGGSALFVLSLVVPLLLGVDDAMDPRRFALFGIPRTRLAIGLGAAALISIPAVCITIAVLATLVTWSRSIGSFVMALVAWPIAVLTCALVSRISAASASLLLSSRRSRESSSAVIVVLLVLISPAAVLLSSLRPSTGVDSVVADVARVLASTPIGAVWAAPASIAAGDPLGLVQLVIALVTLGLLCLAWRGLVGLSIVTPARQGRLRTFGGLGWFARLPARPGWAVAARSLTYWGRDVRYRLALVMLPVTPILIIVALLVAGVPGRPLALLPVPVVALFLGWAGHNDTAYDSTAIWLHVASGVRGRADRLGRALPVLLIGVPFVAIGSFIAAAIYGRPAAALPLLGVSSCLLLSGVGLGFVTSALFPYPVPRPGDSPFQHPNTTSAVTVAVQSITFLAQFVIAAPAALLGGMFLLGTGGSAAGSFATGLALGALVFAGGLALGSRVFRRRGPEILAAALRV